MKTTLSQLWSFFAGVLPLVALCALTNQAQAGCGDYVRVLSHPNGTVPDEHSAESGHRGPSCQHSPLTPIPVPVPSVPVVQPASEAIVIETATHRASGSGGRHRMPADEFATLLPSDCIFQPPRA